MDRESKSKSAAPMVTASATKKKTMKAPFRRLEIEPAENGFTLMHHMPQGEGKEYMYSEPSKMVFNDAGGMMEHLGKMMGVDTGKKNDAKSGKMKDKDTKDMGDNEPDDDD